MSFKDGEWKNREKRLGDEAEGAYRVDRDNRGIPYDDRGFRRPDFTAKQFGSLPPRIRYEPDFIEFPDQRNGVYAEVQGLGRDSQFKIKAEKMDALHWWHKHMAPVFMVVWNNVVRQIVDLSWMTLASLVHRAKQDGNRGVFDPETKPKEYYWVSWEDLTKDDAPRSLT